ncbi:MAG: NAD(P)H-hydrate dehydratase [Gemmatimonadaceae bacterium]
MISVTSSAQAAAADKAAIEAGTPSRALMQRAGAAAAAEIAARFPSEMERGVVVVTGGGNNGGDGWVIARALCAAGIAARVIECVAAKTPDCIAERELALADGVQSDADAHTILSAPESLFVDALLGTGLTADEPLLGAIATGVACLHARVKRGAIVVAIDVPTGVDATNGLHVGAVRSACTLTFGTMKRGLLVARDRCGDIVLLDIGLGAHGAKASRSMLATPRWFHDTLPPIAADAHKGTRKKIVVVGGAEGMAGAAILASRAALRSGAGMVKCVVARESLQALQEAEPAALSSAWPESDADAADHIGKWADAVLIGPGLGRARAREMVERVLRVFAGPVVLDADALNAFEGDVDALAALLKGREALLTPHPAEFARLAGGDVDEILPERFEVVPAFARRVGATVLFKGVPTIVCSPAGKSIVVAEGTPILATGGAGDVLGGIAATLVAQAGSAIRGGALAAFAHGRAASAVSRDQVRGYTLEDVVAALPSVWSLDAPAPRPPVLVELPRVGE